MTCLILRDGAYLAVRAGWIDAHRMMLTDDSKRLCMTVMIIYFQEQLTIQRNAMNDADCTYVGTSDRKQKYFPAQLTSFSMLSSQNSIQCKALNAPITSHNQLSHLTFRSRILSSILLSAAFKPPFLLQPSLTNHSSILSLQVLRPLVHGNFIPSSPPT